MSKKTRQHILSSFYGLKDPFASFPENLYLEDKQGWSSSVHFFLDQSIEEIRPKIVVEIGVWKGRSAIHMGKKIKALNLDAVIIAVDTWLGSSEHWINPKYEKDIKSVHGYPNLYFTFMQNIMSEGLQDVVLPMPLDSINAIEVFRSKELMPELIHIDAGHDYKSVMSDLEAWWPQLRPGGIMVGDDYSSKWPQVYKAWNDFFSEPSIPIEEGENKCRVRKVA